MAGLKELRTRLESIKSTKKITSAMKMMAASRLRKAQIMLVKSHDYSEMLQTATKRILAALHEEEVEKKITYMLPLLLRQKPDAQNYLLLVFSSDRGLCGSYNQNVGKAAIKRISELEKSNCNVQIICYGKKACNIINKHHADKIIELNPGIAPQGLSYLEAIEMAKKIRTRCQCEQCDICEIVYSQFFSALSREVITEQIYPVKAAIAEITDEDNALTHIGNAYYSYTPDKLTFLETLLPRLIIDAIFNAMINSQASEHGARMAAMDNATRNASDIISNLTLRYNSIRQSAITTELTEIISGAEAL